MARKSTVVCTKKRSKKNSYGGSSWGGEKEVCLGAGGKGGEKWKLCCLGGYEVAVRAPKKRVEEGEAVQGARGGGGTKKKGQEPCNGVGGYPGKHKKLKSGWC